MPFPSSGFGFSFGGPPPPPPPPPGPPGGGSSIAPTPPKTTTGVGRGALLSDIASGGIKLRKAVTNDRSAPLVKASSSSSPGPGPGPSSSSSPAGFAKLPTISAPPPIPGAAVANRIRSNSASTADAPSTGSVMATAPQIGGLFAGGMPKLRKAKGSVDTGANRDSSYMSDSTSSPAVPASRPPQLPGRPMASINPASSSPNLRSTFHHDPSCPPRGAPPPPPPPPGTRPPPPTAYRVPPAPPPSRSTPPPVLVAAAASQHSPSPSHSHGHGHGLNGAFNNIAAAVARKVSPAHHSPSHSTSSAPVIPPPPPPPPPPVSAPPAATSSLPQLPPPPPPPPPPPGRGPTVRVPNAGSFTLVTATAKRGQKISIDDSKWKWQREAELPKPQEFKNVPKVYRGGRGNSVPLDFSVFD